MCDLQVILPNFDTSSFTHLLPSLDRHRLTVCDLLTLAASSVHKRAQLPVSEVGRLQDAVRDALHADLGFGQDGGPKEAEKTREGMARDHAAENGDRALKGPDSASVSKRARGKARRTISTLDGRLDEALGGGIPTGYVVEITGESATGKTLLLLQLLLSAQLPPPLGVSRTALYISTESPLPTPRLDQLLSTHPSIQRFSPSERPSLSRILSISAPDPEALEHIIRYQLPVAVRRHNVGIIAIDSVAAPFRTFAADDHHQGAGNPRSNGFAMARRSAQLVQLGTMLRDIARKEDLAIIVANQVSDRFSDPPPLSSSMPLSSSIPQHRQQQPQTHPTSLSTPSASHDTSQPPSSGLTRTPSPPVTLTSPLAPPPSQSHRPHQKPHTTANPLTLDHQQRWFTGWGDISATNNNNNAPLPSSNIISTDQEAAAAAPTNDKTPSLGLVWSHQIAARIALIRDPLPLPSVQQQLQMQQHLLQQQQQQQQQSQAQQMRERQILGKEKEKEKGQDDQTSASGRAQVPAAAAAAAAAAASMTSPEKWNRRRVARVVFAPWCAPSGPAAGGGVEFEVLAEGFVGVDPSS